MTSPTQERFEAFEAALRGAGTDVDSICRAVAMAYGEVDATVVHLWVLDGGDGELRPDGHAVPARFEAHTPIATVPGDSAAVAGLLASAGPLLTELAGAHLDLASPGSIEALGATCTRAAPCAQAILAPLSVAGRSTGLLAVGRLPGAPRLGSADVELTARLADRIALAVDHARLLHGATRYRRQQQAIMRISERALALVGIDELAQLTIDELRAGLEADTANAFTLDPDGEHGAMIACSGYLAPGHDRSFALSPSALDRSRRGDTDVHISHAESAGYQRSTARSTGMRSTLSVLLLPSGERPTFLGAGTWRRQAFTSVDRRFFASASHLLAAGIELRARRETLERQARTDALTGLANRTMLVERLRAVAGAGDASRAVALLLADLDDFKTINDSMGHPEGDRLLRTIAVRLAGVVRPEDVVVRLGGDEFAVLCADVDERVAVGVAERALAVMSQPVSLAGRQVRPRVSVGVSLRGATTEPVTEGNHTDAMLQQADMAMYRAKASGGQRVVVYDDALHEQAQRRLLLEQGLVRAIRRDELDLAYQPVLQLANGRLGGVEALVRWRDPELGVVRPDELIAVAEGSMLVCDVDEWVLRHAARQAVAWCEHGFAPSRVGVNVSGRNFEDAGFVARVRDTLASVRCPPELIVVEITETHAFDDTAARVLGELEALGIRIAVDDYGVGYSSVARLARLPVQILKIDRTFVAGMLDDAAEAAVVRSTIALAHQLGKVVVAEGVEHPEHLRELAALGCDSVQGYLLGRPSDAATVTRWIAEGLDVDLAALLGRPAER